MRVLRAERRTERVHVAQSAAVRLHVQLAAHGHLRVLAEEVLRVVDLAVGGGRNVLHLLVQHRRHREHLAGALAVGRRDDRRVDVLETTLLEEQVRRERARVAHASHRADLRVI